MRVNQIVDKRLRVLPRFALITVDIIGAQVLVAKGVSRHLTVIIQQTRHHLDKRGLARPGRAVAHEGKDKPAQLGKGVKLALEVIGHQHFRQPQRLIFGNMVAHNFMGLLEGHGQLAALGAAPAPINTAK